MEIEEELRNFVVDNFLFGQTNEPFSYDDSFLEKGIIDSMGVLTLVDFVREKYAIVIEDEELIPENWDSVRRITRFVDNKLSSRARASNLVPTFVPKG